MPSDSEVKNDWVSVSNPSYTFMAYIRINLPLPLVTQKLSKAQKSV
jgi:hypothetical protein